MHSSLLFVPSTALALLAFAAPVLQAQATTAPRRPPVCDRGVKVYTDRAALPVPHDTLKMPPGAPIRISNPDEAAAAELAMRGRAGAAGATGLLIFDETNEDGGMMRVRRRVIPIFAPSDSARAQRECTGSRG